MLVASFLSAISCVMNLPTKSIFQLGELAELLAVSRVTVFKQAAAGRIPCFRIGTCVRFDPRAVATWLRKM